MEHIKNIADDTTSYEDAWNELDSAEAGLSDEERQLDEPENDPVDEGETGDADAPAPADEAADAPEPAASEISNDDIWANADPKLKSLFEAERDRAAKAENLIRSNEGRYSAAQKQANEYRTRYEALAANAPAAPAKPKPAELLESLKGDYPEIAEPILAVVGSMQEELDGLKGHRAQAEEQRQAAEQAELETYVNQQQAELEKAHPDWLNTVQSQDFINWFSGSPQRVKDALHRNANAIVDAEEASWVLGLYAESKGTSEQLQQRRERQLAASKAVPGRTATAPSTQPIDDYEAEWKRLDALDRRKAAGR